MLDGAEKALQSNAGHLPPSTRWHESKQMAGVIALDIDVTESNEFADELLSAHVRTELFQDLNPICTCLKVLQNCQVDIIILILTIYAC